MKTTAALLGVILAVSAAALKPASATPDVAIVRVPHGGIQPQASLDDHGVLHLIYFSGEARAGDLYYVRSVDFGETFSTPIRVNSQPGSAVATGTIRGGQIAVGRGGRIHVVWNGSDVARPKGLVNPADRQPSAPFLYARSDADGSHFEPQRNLTRRSYGVDGGGSIAADASGRVYAAWHSLAVGDEAGEDHRLVWIARSMDDGATFSEEQPAGRERTGVCGCCGLRLFAGPSNILYLLYRSATAVTHRDMYLLESTDRGRNFQASRVQPWDVGACPMSSASIASNASTAFAAWETAGQVYFGEIDSQSGRIPTAISAPGDGGTRKHPRLAADARGNVLLVWTEGTAWARGGSVAWQVFDPSGRPTTKGAVPGLAAWSFATPVARPDGRLIVLY
jgi:hypothetical protein